ncbi:hypothetical protein GOQ04_16155 [Emticicia sp. ODNR4P]|nr:hypothetical protein [Emticicia sp. ODNR4P]
MFSKLHLLLITLTLLSYPIHAQVIKGKVVDSKTNLGISFANVYNPNTNVGIHTDEEGLFYWSIQKQNDSVAVSCVGYKTKILSSKNFKKDTTNLIFLEELNIELGEITFKAKKAKKGHDVELGYYHTKPYGHSKWRPGGMSKLDMFVVHIPNNEGIDGFLKNVQYDIDGFRNFTERPKARIRVQKVDPITGLPSTDLLTENLMINFTRFSNNLEIDISKYQIPFSKEGVFVGLEIFCHSEWRLDKNNISQEKSNCPYTPITRIDSEKDSGKSYYWTFHSGKWKWVCITDGSVFQKGLMYKFGVTVTAFE